MVAPWLFVSQLGVASWRQPPLAGGACSSSPSPAAPTRIWCRRPRRADAGLRVVRALSGVCGGVLVAGAAALFVAPVDVGKHWPWALTPLLARAVASWYAMVGTMLLACAARLRRPTEAVIPYATLGAWCLLLLALP